MSPGALNRLMKTQLQ